MIVDKKHSEAIMAEDPVVIERFLNEVDAAAVYANTSTAFTEGCISGLPCLSISVRRMVAAASYGNYSLSTDQS